MKTIALGQVIDEATELETVAMTIDEGSVSVLMRNLTNLYSNPVKAVFREYVSNALDSHIKAGVATPIEVTLPNPADFEPTFVVRDFGVGMSKQEIIDIYSRYGSSTKRDSNTQIGAFGLGAKSALAITDRFDVITIKDGIRVEFFVKKNGQGVGIVHFVDEAPTNEPNGVEVRVPMTSRKAHDFADVAKGFFTTWQPNTVRLNGELNSETIHDTEKFLPITAAGEVFAWVGKSEMGGYRYSSGLDRIKFIVGGIVYDLEKSGSLSNDITAKIGYGSEITKTFTALTQSSRVEVVINLPIGSVELTPSREELMFTDRTVNTIVSVVRDFNEQVPAHFEEYLNTLDRADAVRFYGAMTSYFGSTVAKWHGEIVPDFVEVERAYKVYSREGQSMGDPSFTNRIEVISALSNKGGYHNRTVIVTTDDVTEANAVLLRKNLRDYSASVYGDKNISTVLVSNALNNAWTNLIPSVELDTVLSTAKAYRSAKKSEAQTGTSRTKASYVVWSGGNKVQKVTSDTISGSVLYAVEDKSILNNLFNTTVRDIYRGSTRGNFNEENGKKMNAVFAGNTIIFLPANRSLDNLKKQYPTAVDVNEFYNNKVSAVLNRSDMDSEVLATLVRSGRHGGNIVEMLGMLDATETAALANPVLRAVANEVKKEDSVLVALNSYKNHYEPVATEKGFALDQQFPLLTSVSVFRSMTVEQKAQFVSFANIVVGK